MQPLDSDGAEEQQSRNNRASVVFQHLHASIASTYSQGQRSSVGHRSSLATGPWLLRRSVTEGAAGGTAFERQQSQPQPPWWDEGEDEGEDEDEDGSKRRAAADELTPLVEGGGAAAGTSWRSSWRSMAGRVVPLRRAEQIGVFKAVLAYGVAALFAFVPALREWLGDPEYMAPHLVTNAAIWCHAAQPRSSLAEGALVGALWVCAASAATSGTLAASAWVHEWSGGDPAAGDLAILSKALSLGVVFALSWALAFAKANAARASVGAATAMANIALCLVMLREAPVAHRPDGAGEGVGRKAAHVAGAVVTGLGVSLAVGWFVRPATAGAEARARVRGAVASFRALVPQLLAPVVRGAAPPSSQAKAGGAKAAALKAALREHRRAMQQLRAAACAAGLPLDGLAPALDALSLRVSSMGSALELRVIDHSADASALDARVYAAVIRRIRAPVLQLAAVCDRALEHVAAAVDAALAPRRADPPDADACHAELAAAIADFDAAYACAVAALDRPSGPPGRALGAASTTTEEQLFIVHFFVFSLREFAAELLASVLPHAAALSRAPPALFRPRRVAAALAAYVRVLWDTGATTELEARHEIVRASDPQSLHAPRPATRLQRMARSLWHVLMWTRRLNVRFATKSALLVTALSFPCYWSMDMYTEYRRQRLEWMVISAAAIMVPTVGGSLLVSVYRILGTCAGGLAAFLVYEVGRDNPALTFVLLVMFSVPCFHVILHGKYPKIGQFALLTFGVILINKWVAREDQGEGAGDLAIRRTMSVALGIIAGMLVTMYVWPYEARVRVRQALSWWMLTASILYDRLWSSNSSPFISLDSAEELQSSLVEIRALLADTLNEPRLKGRFPLESYQRIINACQRLLDAMVAARWVAQQTPAPKDLLRSTELVREQRDDLVSLAMYVLASALVLKTPLPAVLPPIHASQRRVAHAMRDILDTATLDDDSIARARYVFYYTQVMLGWEVVQELAIIGGLQRELYGSYGPRQLY
ncbi:hypothetical protein GGI04_002068 [Coemansia thaxteri]|nr:hypothetical protein GGI04_002068 [Coemansia thaxteri]